MTGSELATITRLARRTARRHWKRTALVVALVAIPVAAAVIAAGAVRAGQVSDAEQTLAEFGAANARIDAWVANPDVNEWIDRRIAESGPTAEVLRVRRAFDGLIDGEHVWPVDLDLSHNLASGQLVLTAGAAPSAPNDVAVSEHVLDRLGRTVGDEVELTIAGVEQSVEITGTVRHPLFVRDRSVVLAAGALDDPAGLGLAGGTTWLVGGVDGRRFAAAMNEAWLLDRGDFVPPAPGGPQPAELADLPYDVYAALSAEQAAELVRRSSELHEEELWGMAMAMADGNPVAVPDLYVQSAEAQLAAGELGELDPLSQPPIAGTLLAGLLLAEVALVAGAAYATGTRRRIRELGLMGANGATVGHIRATVIGEGAFAGIVGALTGAVIGASALVLGRSLLQRFVERHIQGVPLSFLDIIGPVLAGALAAIAAAWLPARTASRVPTTTALQGRVPTAQPRRWVTPLGIALAGIGAFLLAVATTASGDRAAIQGSAGVVLMIGGFAVMTGPLVAWAGRSADRMPATLRLVIRDAARQRTRASAATAAIMVVLVVPVVMGVPIGNEQRREAIHGLDSPGNHVVVLGSETSFEDPDIGRADEESMATVAGLMAWDHSVTMDVVGVAARTFDEQRAVEAGIIAPMEIEGGIFGRVAIGTVALAEALGEPEIRASIESGTPVVLGTQRRQTSLLLDGAVTQALELPVRVLSWGMPRILVPPDLVDREAWEVVGSKGLFVAGRDLSAGERSAIWRTEVQVALVENGPFSGTETLLLALGAVLLVVLLIIALVTALAATESDGDLRLMVAVGAPPSVRRRFLGLQTAYYTWFAALLAVPSALLLMRVVTSNSTWVDVGPFGWAPSNMFTIPWLAIGGVTLGIPLLVGAVTALVVRSAPTMAPRRV